MRSIRTIALLVLAIAALAVMPAATAGAVPLPGAITAVQDLSEPCGDTTGADVIVAIDGGAPNTLYRAEIAGVTSSQTVTDANGDGSLALNNAGLSNVTVQVTAANFDSRNLGVNIQCGTGSGKD